MASDSFTQSPYRFIPTFFQCHISASSSLVHVAYMYVAYTFYVNLTSSMPRHIGCNLCAMNTDQHHKYIEMSNTSGSSLTKKKSHKHYIVPVVLNTTPNTEDYST